MKKLNKLFVVISIATMLITLTGCNDISNSSNNIDNQPSSIANSTEETNTEGENSKDEAVDKEKLDLLNTLASAKSDESILNFDESTNSVYVNNDVKTDILVIPVQYNDKDIINFNMRGKSSWLVVDPLSFGKLSIEFNDTMEEACKGVYYDGKIYPFSGFCRTFNNGYDPKLFNDEGFYLTDAGKTLYCYSPELDKSINVDRTDFDSYFAYQMKVNVVENDVTIPEGIETISDSAFENKPITSVKFPSTLKIIGNSAFYDTSLKEMSPLPNGLQKIDYGAFKDCDLINSSVIIPDSVTEIGIEVFNSAKISSLTIGKGITEINNCFNYMPSLAEVTIPSNVEKIYGKAFAQCENLHTVIFEDGCTEIIDDSFWNCPTLKTVKLPNTLKKLDMNAFSANDSLEELIIPDNTYIFDSANNKYNPNLKVTYRGTIYTPDNFKEMYKASSKK